MQNADGPPPSEHLFHLTVQAGRALPLPERLPLRLGNAHFLPVAAPTADHRQPAAGLGRSEEAGRDVPGPEHPGAGQQPSEICDRLPRYAEAPLPQPAQHQPQQLRSEMMFLFCFPLQRSVCGGVNAHFSSSIIQSSVAGTTLKG